MQTAKQRKQWEQQTLAAGDSVAGVKQRLRLKTLALRRVKPVVVEAQE